MKLDEWFTSSFSTGTDCVEVKITKNDILVRDSKNPNGEVLRFDRTEWNAFIAGAKDDQFTLP